MSAHAPRAGSDRRARRGPLRPRGLAWLAWLAVLSLPGAAPAQQPLEIVNVAVCEYDDPFGPGRLARSSNRVVTGVVAQACVVEPPVLAVEPAGTVPPGALLRYTLKAANTTGSPLTGVVLELPLPPELEDPVSYTDGEVPLPDDGTLVVDGSWDPLSRTVTWRIDRIEDGVSVAVEAETAVRSDAPADGLVSARGSCIADGCPVPVPSNPVDSPIVPPVLGVTKRADRSSAVPGDAVLYEITVRHDGDDPPLDETRVVDVLPRGMRYVPGSATVDGTAAPDPGTGADGRTLTFTLGPLAPGESRVLRFAVIVTPGARRGDAVNRARAVGRTGGGADLESAPASAVVALAPGPFREEAYLVGRVFVDDDGDGRPDEGEPGVPGVLVVMEDGRGAVTDVTGRWHVEGVRPGVHVVRLDPVTLADGLVPVAAGAEWARNPRTRFVEARASTLVVTDFPLGPAGAARCRVERGRGSLVLPAVALFDGAGRPRPAFDALVAQAAGYLDSLGHRRGAALGVRCAGEGEAPLAAETDVLRLALGDALAAPGEGTPGHADAGGQTRNPAPDGATVPGAPFDELLRTAPAGPAIVAPLPGTRTNRAAITVDVLYPDGRGATLLVNGVPVPASRVGARSSLPARGLAAARYVGVPLSVGRNLLELRVDGVEGGGGAAATVLSEVHLPGAAVALRLEVPGERWTADGTTPGTLVVEAVDAAGMRAAERPVVTLHVEDAEPVTPDHDPATPGLQVRLRDGRAEVRFAPRTLPGRARVLARWETIEAERFVDVLPGGDRWRVTGLAEGRLAGDGGVEGDGGRAPGLGDGVEDGGGGRLAVFAQGPIGEASRLTLSVDTERERDRRRLGGFLEPDLFFPVPGDAALRTEQAETQGKLFARIDGPRGFAQWGDFQSGLERTELVRYDRRLNGVSGRVASGPFALQAFAASTEQLAARDVFAPDGTSGPYLLGAAPVVARSETVIVETRDRFRSDRVLRRTLKRRDLDYNLDPWTGALLFRAPVPPFDAELNPLRIVVLYETDGGDREDRLAAGGRLSLRAGERFEAGLSAIHEERAGDDLRLYGVDLSWRPVAGTTVRGELASSEQQDSATAVRLEVSSRRGPNLAWEVAYRDVPAGFQNPSLLGSPELGTRHAGGSVRWRPAEDWQVRAEAFTQRDDGLGLRRSVAGADVERRFGDRVAVLAGARSVSTESGALGDASSTLVRGGARGRIGGRWSGEILREQRLGGETAIGYPTRTAAGLGYDLRDGTRLFLRQELESGDGPDRDRTVLGMESRVGEHTRALHEYRLDEGADGAALRSMTGVETLLPVGRGGSARFSAARLDTVRGDGQADFATLAGGYEYRAGRSLVSTRYEVRVGEQDRRHLLTAAGAWRPDGSWTLFVRQRLFATDPEAGDGAWRAEGLFGAAYRPAGGTWRALGRLDHSTAGGTPQGAGGTVPGGVLPEPAGSALSPAPAPGAPGIGVGPGREATVVGRDSLALSLAAGARLTGRQRLGASIVARRVGDDRAAGVPATLTSLLSLHYTAEVRPRWTVGGSLRRFAERETGLADYGAGVEVGFLVLRDLWVLGGYNLAGFEDDDIAGLDRTDSGPFLSLRFKFDEHSLRLDR